MKFIYPILFVLSLIFITACSNNASEKEAMGMVNPADTGMGFISSSAAVGNKGDSTRKFIRTAELKFRVNNVVKSTTNIEDIASKNGGFVTYTNLTSSIDELTTTTVSADSSLETTHFTVSNNMIIRVPTNRLDSTLREIANDIEYLDYRVIKADDVALQILANNLSQKRAARNEERLTKAIDERGKKLSETAVVEDVLFDKQEKSDEAKIANLSLGDQIKFSTINLQVYQRPTLKREVIPNEKNIDEFEPSIGARLLDSFEVGWGLLEGFVLILAKLWSVALIAVAVIFTYKKFGKNWFK